MWMFTKYGFFSIVLDSRDHSKAAIRARATKDLDALAAAFPALLGGRQQVLTPNRDYYCRLVIEASELPQLYAAMATAIDYDDFKTELKRTHVQDDKLPLLNRLWEAMNDYQHQVHPGMGLYNSWRKPRTTPKGPAKRRTTPSSRPPKPRELF